MVAVVEDGWMVVVVEDRWVGRIGCVVVASEKDVMVTG